MSKHFGCCALLLSGLFLSALYGCKKEDQELLPDALALMQIPEGFPMLTFPEGNEYSPERWALGKRLFYDPILSRQNTISCGSCHMPAKAFSDSIAFSIGDNNVSGTSNAPTLANVGYHPYFTRAGGVPTLEMQILVPIQEHDELNTNIVDIVARLKTDTSYVAAAVRAYGREIDAFVVTRAIANFERSMLSGSSSFDEFEYQHKSNALSASAQRGLQLFRSDRTNCSKCHGGFNFTNYAFENNGLYEHYADSGRMRLTKLESDRARFKVPSLRNIALTAPYMHDGSMKRLQEVIAHYNSGGVPHKNKSTLIKPIGLSEQEQADLVAFLNSLTDLPFVNNKNFKNEGN